MGTAGIQFESWSGAWRTLWQNLAPRCQSPDCPATGLWRRFRRKRQGIRIHGAWHCLDECLERTLIDILQKTRAASKRPPTHRIPLGLLLLSRQELTASQLQAALAAQRKAGRGRIGEWLQTLGFVNEQQVTAALARQWSCPIWRTRSAALGSDTTADIPVILLLSSFMIPITYVQATATLHLAFGELIDYSVLYAIEQMLGCHTEPCLAAPSLLRANLERLATPRRESEVLFDGLCDVAESARIIRSYSLRVAASEIRMVACGSHLWVRLIRSSRRPMDLLLRRSPSDPVNVDLPARSGQTTIFFDHTA